MGIPQNWLVYSDYNGKSYLVGGLEHEFHEFPFSWE